MRRQATAPVSDLTLDVDARERRSSRAFEPLSGFGSQEHDGAIVVLEEVLALVVDNELCRFNVRFEVELLGNKAEGHSLLVSRVELATRTRKDGGDGRLTPCRYCTEQRDALGRQTYP